MVHRDIKPANILLDAGPDMRVKLTDFGLARAADDASLTQSGSVAGTPMYMAPEQARGEAFDHRADLFSLGSVLYVMCCGRPPFRAANSLAVLKRVTDDTPRPLREVMPEVPDWLGDVIAKLHAKKPADRYQSAREVAEVLTSIQSELERGTVVRRPAKPRRRWWLPAAAAVGVLALAVMGGVLKRPQQTPPEQPAAPPAVAEARPIQKAAAKTQSADRFTNAVGMEFVRVPAGTAWLGGGGGTPGEDKVVIPTDFYLGVYEVTQGEWDAVMGPGKNPSRFSRHGEKADAVAGVSDEDLKRYPVDGVSWNQCLQFVARLNELAPEAGWVYRLPTSVEWEYACRGGPMAGPADSAFDFYAGVPSITLRADRANFKGNGRGRTCPVGSYPPNRLGLHDLHGNVFEHCNDRVGTDADPLRLLCGGAFCDEPSFCRARNRNVGNPNSGFEGGGLRVARVPAGENK
jgi:formylglycine-generating enzyme required for sulfatase activity